MCVLAAKISLSLWSLDEGWGREFPSLRVPYVGISTIGGGQTSSHSQECFIGCVISCSNNNNQKDCFIRS